MVQGVLNEIVSEHFTVADSNGNLVSGIPTVDFTLYVYNPSGAEVSGFVGGGISELGDGNYKYTFTPNTTGTWYITATHPTYFPWGKSDDVQVYNTDLTEIYDNVIKTLGLVHHNIYIDDSTYDENGNMISARVRIYSDAASVGTDFNVVETYRIEADATDCGQFSYWKQVKV
jgi:hypothetical protein